MVEYPAALKRVQNFVNLIASFTPILVLAFPRLHEFLTPEVFAGITTALGGLNIYITVASTDKIGL